VSIKTIIIDPCSNEAVAIQDAGDFGKILTTVDPLRILSVFKTTKIASGDGTGSTTVATPRGDGSIVVTDLIVSFEKKTSAEVLLQFNDGTNDELVWFGDMQDAPISFGVAFAGRWQGWQNAYLEIVVAGAGLDGSIGVGYAKVSKENSLMYAEWDARR